MLDLYTGHSDYEKLKHLLVQPNKSGHVRKANGPDLTLYGATERGHFKGGYEVGQKSAFERYAFSRLYDALSDLGVTSLYRCQNARVDGALDLCGRVPQGLALLEMKYTLNWASFNSALGQFIGGEKLLRRSGKIQSATRGVILFSDFGHDWLSDDPNPLIPWTYFHRHVVEVSDKFHITALQITPTGFYNPFLEKNPVNGRIAHLFQAFRPFAA